MYFIFKKKRKFGTVSRSVKSFRKKSDAEYKELKEKARTLIHERLKHYNAYYNFSYNKVAIRNQKSRWGSCSARKNLNFNYRLVLLSPELLDYVVVHELCHLQEMNHGKKFWDLVARTVPDYKERKVLLLKVKLI
jgi:predicted metal-dependent hydrolase